MSGLVNSPAEQAVSLGARVDRAQSEAEKHGLTSYVLGFIGGRLIAGEMITVDTLEAAVVAGKESRRRANRGCGQ